MHVLPREFVHLVTAFALHCVVYIIVDLDQGDLALFRVYVSRLNVHAKEIALSILGTRDSEILRINSTF